MTSPCNDFLTVLKVWFSHKFVELRGILVVSISNIPSNALHW